MLSVLAIESQGEQAALLRDLVAKQINGQLMLVDSVDAAFTAIDRRAPNLILVSALMPPRQEAELISRLRSLPGLASVDVLFTPLLGRPDEDRPEQQRRWFKPAPKVKAASCAPSTFADQLRTHLERIQLMQEASLSERQASERRSAVRVSNVDRAKLMIEGSNVNLIDLSVIGAQVVSQAVLLPGRLLQVVFESNRETVRCQGQIVWGIFDLLPATRVPCYRAGIGFKDIDQRFLERLCLPRTDAKPRLEAPLSPYSGGRALSGRF